MTRLRKSRKPAPLGPKREPRVKKALKDVDKRVKKTKGLGSGNRNNPQTVNPQTTNKIDKAQLDPRHGSKKAIELTPQQPISLSHFEPQVKLRKVEAPELTPEQELALIENDERMQTLLDRQENGELLTGKDAKYFNIRMARHEQLMDLLGLSYDDEEDDEEQSPASLSLIERWERDDWDKSEGDH